MRSGSCGVPADVRRLGDHQVSARWGRVGPFPAWTCRCLGDSRLRARRLQASCKWRRAPKECRRGARRICRCMKSRVEEAPGRAGQGRLSVRKCRGVPDLAGQDQLTAHIAATAAHESPQAPTGVHRGTEAYSRVQGTPPHLGGLPGLTRAWRRLVLTSSSAVPAPSVV